MSRPDRFAGVRAAASWPRRRAKQAVQWAVWSRQRFAVMVVVATVVIGLALTITLTNMVVAIQGAVGQARGGAEATASLATGDPGQSRATGLGAAPSSSGTLAGGPPMDGAKEPTMAPPTPPILKPDVTPEQLTRSFMESWLAGAHRPATAADHDAWVKALSGYGADVLPTQLAATPYAAIPDATVTTVRVDTLGATATATVTLSSGKLVLVQLAKDPMGWRIHGYHAGV